MLAKFLIVKREISPAWKIMPCMLNVFGAYGICALSAKGHRRTTEMEETVTVTKDDLEQAFRRWDEESAKDSSGDASPAGKAEYFMGLLLNK